MLEDDILEAVQSAFRECARRTSEANRESPWKQRLSLEGGAAESIEKLVAAGLGVNRLGPQGMQCLRRVFFELCGLGFIVPSEPTQAISWNSQAGVFTFSTRGLAYFLESTVMLERKGALETSLGELDDRCAGAVGAGQQVLLGEAQRCWKQGCYRAAMVLVGVANEEAGVALLDLLDAYPNKAPASSSEWAAATSSSNSFSTRFEAGMKILRRLATALKKEARKRRQQGDTVPWGDLWFRSVDSLHGMGEAIRCARNHAAHDGSAEFRRGDVGLLLSTMPMLLEHVWELSEFLRSPPEGLDLPEV